MPRVTDPSLLTRGGGLSARRSVEATSFVHPTQGLDSTIAHIVDPRRAHMAEAVGVVDVAGNFSSDDVEGALAELASGGGATEQNGVYQGCTYVAAGLGATLATPSSVVINGTLRDMAGLGLTLTDNATNWLYVHGTTGVLSKQVGAPPPVISSPEHVLLARIVTAAGAVTSSRDARWFVRNNDRKLPCTVRSVGAEADRNSEAAFESIDAAILYLENFGVSGVMRNTTLILKGSQTISSSVIIPVNGVTLQGEDGCILTFSTVNAVMIDVSGRSAIRIRDITFRTNGLGAIAIGCPTGGVLTEVYVERCVFSAGTQDWETGIDFDVAGPQNRVVIRDCDITATAFGIRMRDPTNSRVLDTVITESGSGGSYGLHLGNILGPVGNTEDCQVRGVRVVGFGTGGFAHGPRMQVVGCNFTGADTGLILFGGVSDGVVSGTTIRLSGTTGLIGIDVLGDNIRIADCRVYNPKAAGTYVAEVPVGVRIATGSDYITVTGTKVEGFLNSVAPEGYGIHAEGASVDLIIDGCQVSEAYRGITTAAGTNVAITGTTVRDVDIGIVLGGANSIVTGGSVIVSSTRGVTGISVGNSDTVITGCTVVSARNVFAGETPVGISIGASDVKVSNCVVRGWQNVVGALGAGIKTAAGAARVTVDATTVIGCWSGFVTLGVVAANEVTLSDCMFRNIVRDAIYFVNSNRVRVSDCTLINSGSTDAIYVEDGTDIEVVNCKVFGNSATVRGIHFVGADVAADRVRRFVISGNNISEVTGDGILLEGYVQNGVVSNNQVDCFLPAAPSDPTALACIRLASTGTTALVKSVAVSGNVCLRAQNGIIVTGNSVANQVAGVSITGNTIHHCAVGSGGTTTCAGIDLTWTLDTSVVGNTTYSIGLLINNSDAESAPTAGANVIPYGIHTLNSHHIRVEGNSVTDITAAGAGFSFGMLLHIKDNPLAVDARAISITDNQVMATDGTAPIGTGIMVSVGTSGAGGNTTTLNGLVVSGNSIRRAEYLGISIVSGGGCTMQQVVVSGNSVSGVLDAAIGYGISLTAQAATVLTDGILREVEVVGNNVGNAEKYGIYVTSGNGCRLTGVAVRDNTVADTGDIGIYFNGALTPADFGRFLVSGNVISGAANEGIYLSSTDFDLDDVSVLGNTVNGGLGAAATGQGIRIATTASAAGRVSMDRLTVSGNKVFTQDSLGINVNLDGTLYLGVVSGNIVHVNTASASPMVLVLDTPGNMGADVYSGEINISGNTLVGGGAVAVSLDHRQNLRNFTFSNNIRQESSGHGFVLEVLNATVGSKEAVDGVTISGNTFENIQQMGVRLLFGDATAITECSNISVTDNRFNECALDGTDNIALFVRGNARLQNLRVSGNDFKSIGTLDSAATGNLTVRLGSTSTNSGENVVVSGNSFNACSGIAILVDDYSLAAGWTLVNLKVEGNSVQEQVNDAIRINLATFTSVRTISVSGNTIDNVSGVASDTGIRVVGPTANDLNQLSVCRNTVRNTGAVNQGAIYVSSADDINGLVIDGNSLQGTTATIAGIYVSVSGLWTGGSVSNNNMASSASDGVRLSCAGAAGATGLLSLVLNGNQVLGAANVGVRVLTTNAGVNPSTDNLTLTGNVVIDAGDEGIYVNATAPTNITLSGNTIRNSGGENIWVSASGSTSLTTVSVTGNDLRNGAEDGIQLSAGGDISGVSVSGNTVTGPDQNGVVVFASGDLYSVSIVGNTISSWAGEALAGVYFGIELVGDSAHGVAIASNSLRSANDGATGIYLRGTAGGGGLSMIGQVRGLNIQDNVVVLDSTPTTSQSLLIDCGALADGGTQLNVSFTGNSFRGAVTGVGRAGTGFAPDRSVCSLNNEQTSAGAGNWGTFETYFAIGTTVALNNQN